MKRKGRTTTGMWLLAGGVGGSIAAGLVAANYAVGGIDPFYRTGAPAVSSAPDAHDVAVVHDGFLPSTGIATEMTADPVSATPIPAPAALPLTDWDAVDARAQREMDQALALAEAPFPAEPNPAPRAPDAAPRPPAAATPEPPPTTSHQPTPPSVPTTPNGTLIY